MALQLPGSHDNNEELAVAVSYPVPPTAIEYYPLFRDDDFDGNVGEEKLPESEAELVEVMGEDLVVHPSFRTCGPVEGGFHDLTWEEGLEIIDNYDWGQLVSEGPQDQHDEVSEARTATPAVEALQVEALPSSRGSQIVPRSVDCMVVEPSTGGDTSHLKSDIAAPLSRSSRSPSHHNDTSQTTVPPAPPPAPSKASQHPRESSSLWKESLPTKATIGPVIITSTTPPEAAEACYPTGLLSESSAPPEGAAELDTMSSDNMVVDKIIIAKGTEEAAEGSQEPLGQSVASEKQGTPASHTPDQAVTPSDTATNPLGEDIQDKTRLKADEEMLEEAQTQLNPDAAEETEATDFDSLFEDDADEEADQEQQLEVGTTNVVYPQPESAEQVDVLAQASSSHAGSLVVQSSELVADDAPIRPPSAEDDIAAQIMRQFELEEQKTPLPTPLEEIVADVSTAAEALLMLSNGARPTIGCGQTGSSEFDVAAEISPMPLLEDMLTLGAPDIDPPDLALQLLDQNIADQESSMEEIHGEAIGMDVTNAVVDVDVDDNPDPAPQAESPGLISPNQSHACDVVMNEQSPQSNTMKQGLSSDVILPKGTPNVDENETTAEPATVSAPSEESAVASPPHPRSWWFVPKLKIGSAFWNAASSVPHGGAQNDTDVAEGIPASPTDAEDEPETTQAELDLSPVESPTDSREDDHGLAELSDAPAPRVDVPPILPNSPGEEGAPSGLEKATPQPLLPGLEEHAAAASSPTVAPSSPAMASDLQTSPWAGRLLEQQLEMPPSPFEAEPTTSDLSGDSEVYDSDPTPSKTAKASLKIIPDVEPTAAQLPVPKQDTPHDTPDFPFLSLKAPETLPSPVSPTFSPEKPLPTDTETKPTKLVPKKRAHPATTKKAKPDPKTPAAYKAEADSGSEFEAPAKKKSRPTQGSTLLSLKTPSIASRRGLAAPHRSQSGKKAKQMVVEEELVDREDTDGDEQEEDEDYTPSAIPPPTSAERPTASNLPPYWALETTYGKRVTRGDMKTGSEDPLANKSPVQEDNEEMLVDAEPSDSAEPASRTKGGKQNGKATAAKKKPGPAKTPATLKPPAVRKARTPATAAAATPSAITTSQQRSKYGFKPPTGPKRPTGRKRKAIADTDPDADAVDELPATLSARQTRRASAVREEAERLAEIEKSVARRTRGAKKSAG